jgi:energy-coupling factor transporter ATP-binding protein EcfA2
MRRNGGKSQGMDDKLLEIVLERLGKSPLAEDPTDLLLAAFESEESLSVQLSGEAAARPSADVAGVAPSAPAGAYLQSLTVSGFREIGEPAALRLQPGPGLTVVVGRNGSGKSSFAEALEVLLTGQLRRWEKLPVVWRQGWRSMHHPQQAQITADFLVEGAGAAVVQRTWPDGADFANSSVYVQFRGEKRTGLEQPGWSAALADHRPFLAHSEIEAFFGSPSGLYELLASVLGLEDLNVAAARLRQARLSWESAFKEVTKSLRDLLIRLEGTADERARSCLAALSGRTPDLVAAKQIAAGTRARDDGSELGRLRRLAQLTAPAEDEVRDVAAAVREAAAGLEAVAGSSAGRAQALAALLAAALQHHEAHGDGDCPVCGRPGALTAQWRQATEQEVARLAREAQDAEDAERAAAGARRHALTPVQPCPPVLSEAAPWGVDPGPALAAWAKWAAVPDPGAPLTAAGLHALADHLEQALHSVTAELGSLSADADAKYAERVDAWAPVAAAVSAWCASAVRAQVGLAPVASVKAAEAWLKAATDEIRNQRLAPLATQAKSIWAMLRQESNVDLGAIRLAGSSTQRHVELDVSVDGAPGSALGVMSQGEVNALALAVFLPRARLPASPFRFLVIDDPVQAMDPAKVDGLARVLEKGGR